MVLCFGANKILNLDRLNKNKMGNEHCDIVTTVVHRSVHADGWRWEPHGHTFSPRIRELQAEQVSGLEQEARRRRDITKIKPLV